MVKMKVQQPARGQVSGPQERARVPCLGVRAPGASLCPESGCQAPRSKPVPKQKRHPVVNRTGDGSRVRCCKEQYCIGTWNVKSMNQGKLEVVKQEMARVNIDILGISKLRWTEMGEFNSDDHYIYYCGQESLRRNGPHPLQHIFPAFIICRTQGRG